MEETKTKREDPFINHLSQTHNHNTSDRIQRGKSLRQKTPRKHQAAWTPPANRRDPVELLVESGVGRMQELLPIRYGRMLASPFAFYRGAAAIMAYDLAHTPATGITLQACGDCHLLNFGGFATGERNLIFDINDFDETSIAPWEWDIKRLSASFVVAGRENGFSSSVNREAAWMAAQSYRQQMAMYAEMSILEVWYAAIDLDSIFANMPDKQILEFYTKKLNSATKQRSHEKEFTELAFLEGEQPRIIDQPPLIFHYGDLQQKKFSELIMKSIAGYRKSLSHDKRVIFDRYHLVDAAAKVVGIGSVGSFCGIFMFMSGNGEPLFLQFKQARRSVLEPYAGVNPYAHTGQRVVEGQRLMQTASDMFLGWTTGAGGKKRQFFLRQLSDIKVKPVIQVMKPSHLISYAHLCGRALARAHARSGDVLILASYLGKSEAFEDALVDFSEAYADQNERDHAALVLAVRNGRIQVQQEL
jgi:uncharacterized protein (DUF2252 family)